MDGEEPEGLVHRAVHNGQNGAENGPAGHRKEHIGDTAYSEKESRRRSSTSLRGEKAGYATKNEAHRSHMQSNRFTLHKEGIRVRAFRILGLEGNPVVTTVSQAVIWALILVSVLEPDTLFLNAASVKKDITKNFTWLYIGAQNIWVFFIAYLWLSPTYSKIKLGRDDEKPEFATVAWFMMMFMSAGAGTGLVFYGVGEPIYHLSYNRYVAKGTMTYNELSQESMNLTYYHWGVHAWMCYTIVALSQGIVSHRMGLPLTIRSCFFPIFGTKIFEWFGDAVDTISTVSTVFGICTTMGIGAVQLNTGLNSLNPGIEKSILVQVFLIAIMTIVGGISAHAGLNAGVRVLSITAFICVTTVMLMVLVMDSPTFLLNFFVQSLGYHMSDFVKLGFHTDAFEQLDGGVDGRAGPPVWMDWWTVFYWGWWVAWSPFVGLFIAKISRGRTIKEVINASITGPVLYNFLWFAIFGGAGLKMERDSIIDACLGSCTVTKGGRQFLRKFCDSTVTLSAEQKASRAASFLVVRPEGCDSIVQLSTVDLDEMWFALLDQYENVGGFLVVVSLISIVLFFITTNDSGSIILDLMGTSGKLDANPVQKQLWSLTLGATSIALLIAGGSQSLTAIQTALNAIGLPMTILITVLCTALKTACDMETHPDTNRELSATEGRFETLFQRDNGFEFWQTSMLGGIFDSIEWALTLGKHPFPGGKHWRDWSICVVAPYYYLAKAYALNMEIESGTPVNIFSSSSQQEVRYGQGVFVASFLCFNLGIIFFILESVYKNYWVVGFAFYFMFGCMVVTTRSSIRRMAGINGDLLRDGIASFIAYPFAVVQMWNEVLIRDKGMDAFDD